MPVWEFCLLPGSISLGVAQTSAWKRPSQPRELGPQSCAVFDPFKKHLPALSHIVTRPTASRPTPTAAQSIVFDQAENRMHAQNGIMIHAMWVAALLCAMLQRAMLCCVTPQRAVLPSSCSAPCCMRTVAGGVGRGPHLNPCCSAYLTTAPQLQHCAASCAQGLRVKRSWEMGSSTQTGAAAAAEHVHRCGRLIQPD